MSTTTNPLFNGLFEIRLVVPGRLPVVTSKPITLLAMLLLPALCLPVKTKNFSSKVIVNNNQIEYLWQYWANSTWMNQHRWTKVYDGNNNMIEEILYNGDGTNWVPYWKFTYSYIPITGFEPTWSGVNNYRLSDNYPNPFNPSTTIEFDLPKTSEVSLKVFNILGEEVTTLVSDRLSPGSYSYEWDASNLASGVYLYRLQAGDYVETRKMILMR